MRIEYAPSAVADYEALVSHLESRNPRAASELADRIRDAIENLAARAFEGPAAQLTTGEKVRSWPVPPVRIYYQRRADVFWVLRIYHQARAPIAP